MSKKLITVGAFIPEDYVDTLSVDIVNTLLRLGSEGYTHSCVVNGCIYICSNSDDVDTLQKDSTIICEVLYDNCTVGGSIIDDSEIPMLESKNYVMCEVHCKEYINFSLDM